METGISIHQILINLGYNLKDCGREYRTKPIYRDSDNDTVLRIYKDTGFWVDFKENISGDFTSLVKMSLKLDSEEQAKTWLKDKNYQQIVIKDTKPQIKEKKTFDKDLLLKLNKNHEYWIKRGVNTETISLFHGGIASAGKMKDRYVFPIFDSKNEIVGFSGRDITNKSKIKWKHLGDKSSWCYPSFLNVEEIKKQKEVIIIESIGDCLSLHQAGIKNTIVTFGLEVSVSILNFLLKLDPEKIYISFNNDNEKNNAGNNASEKAFNKLLRYFDKKQLQIKLPTKKDFGEMNEEEILKWKNNS
jgi:5S rRNA maturation endonuclease (ribonuclease M5)